MANFQDTLAELFSDKLNFQYNGQPLPTPEIDGNENIINYTKEYEGLGTDIILVECNDRIIEFQKKLIKNQKSFFPNAHFLFVSNGGKVFDIYNNSISKKLKKITYDVIGRNTRLFKEKLQLFNVSNASDGTELQINVEKAFDTSDKVTKKFFDKFKKIHDKLQKAIIGIDDEKDKSWYASVMMNRLMFIYFLQKHYVIQNNTDFLLQKFDEVTANGKDYYKDFLLPLFFYGFARRDNHPEKEKFVEEYGSIRYLNGGLFYPHHLEKKYTNENVSASIYEEKALQTNIGIDAKLLKEILTFLNGYTWYLDNRPMKEDTDINPDVLGYIFEKYINQKELGAYYTKEDITEYISKNTIIPFILDKMKANRFDAPDPNPMITNNEDIIGNIGNYVDAITDYNEIKFLYKDVLLELSVLDPAVGSGAFLFSALNILLPIYQKTVFRLKEFNKTIKDTWLQETISTISKHAEEYFLTKQIILNNLYGVDIVEEATEICKLRLFLQLASHLPDITSIEPLPDIDFNIYAGNSLVGGLSWEDLEANYTMDLFTSANRDNIKADITTLSNLKTQYREVQQDDDNEDELTVLKDNIITLEHRVNNDINIGIDNPFHWFIDFNKILNKGGFDVIIGNPPYVEYSKVKKTYQIINYQTERSGNLYSYFIERSDLISNENNYSSFIVPVSVICTDRMSYTQNYITQNYSSLWVSSFAERPSKLFEGAERNVSILIYNNRNAQNKVFSTEYIKWYSANRNLLFNSICYQEITDIIKESVIQKIGSSIEVDICKKIENCDNTISSYLSNSNKNNKVVYRNSGGRYWKVITNFTPYFTIDGKQQISSRESYLYAKNEQYQYAIIGALSSTTYYWWYIQNSDTRTNNPSHLKKFPVNLSKIDLEKLASLGKKLMVDYKKNAQIMTKNQKTGYTEYAQFNPKLSKSLIDEIDKEISKSYGFDNLEIDFIKNYAIDFRMGETS
jgi:Eco57I restriction-modification methylase